MTKAVCVLALVLAGGCAHPAGFEPEGRESLAGQDAAYYELTVDGKHYGDVKVRSRGMARADGETLARLDVRVRNDSNETLELYLGGTDLEVVTEKNRLVLVEGPVVDPEDTRIPARTAKRFHLDYALGRELEPRDLEAFEFNWSVRTASISYSRSTPFVRSRPDRPDTYVSVGLAGTFGPSWWHYRHHPHHPPWWW